MPDSVAHHGRTIALTALATALACSPGQTGVDAAPAKQAAPPAAQEPAPSPAAPDPYRAAHERMVGELAELTAQILATAPYLGDAKAKQLRAQLEGAGPDLDPVSRTRLLYQLGQMELEVGREDEAIAALEEAFAALPELRAQIPPGAALDLELRLGVAHLRRGETRNCCARSNADSCILPIRGGGLHLDEEGSRAAMKVFTGLAERTADDPTARAMHRRAVWLLNVAAMTVGEHPDGVPKALRIPAAAFQPAAASADFPHFVNRSGDRGIDRESLAGGAIVDDFDGDGLLDVIVSSWHPSGTLALWKNNGDGTFTDKLEGSGLEGITGGLNLVHADHDNDGDLDLLVLRGAWLGPQGAHPNSLLRNDGGFKFTDITFAVGLGDRHFPTQTAAWADVDRDGDLDLYIGNESTPRARAPSQLFRHDLDPKTGASRFVDVAAHAGVSNERMAKGVAWGDYDGDGDFDLYVSNLGGDNRLYRNDTAPGAEHPRFTDVARELGVQGPRESFPTWFWDYDNDGALDLFVASYPVDVADIAAIHLGAEPSHDTHRLYKGDGRGGFTDVTEAAGLQNPTSVMGSNFGDVDGDGFLDLYLGTGAPPYEMLIPNQMYRGDGQGGFVDVTFAGGFGHLQKGHGVAFADLDHDGDVDVFEQMGGAFLGDRFGDALYDNPGFGRRWISIELVGAGAGPDKPGANRSAIGAHIHVRASGLKSARSIHRHVGGGGSFGENPLRQFVGLDAATHVESIEVTWPGSGAVQRVTGVPLDTHVRITEGREGFEPLERPPLRPR